MHQVWGDREVSDSGRSDSGSQGAPSSQDGVIWNRQSDSSFSRSSSAASGRQETSARVPAALDDLSDKDEDDGKGECVAPSSELPSLGSEKHATGNCTPCHYFCSRKGCALGASCFFCHLHEGEYRARPCKAKRAKAKVQASVLDLNIHTPEEVQRMADCMVGQGQYLETVVKSKLRDLRLSGQQPVDEAHPPDDQEALGVVGKAGASAEIDWVPHAAEAVDGVAAASSSAGLPVRGRS
mmetsp:Transcript_49548/g.111439  ORF Transcript_49548/g.111439 Transcript_49548/m.111439 type:complete len:239 (-) Transcript_49548:105-821(-)